MFCFEKLNTKFFYNKSDVDLQDGRNVDRTNYVPLERKPEIYIPIPMEPLFFLMGNRLKYMLSVVLRVFCFIFK